MTPAWLRKLAKSIEKRTADIREALRGASRECDVAGDRSLGSQLLHWADNFGTDRIYADDVPRMLRDKASSLEGKSR